MTVKMIIWRLDGRVVMQRPAKPWTPVRLRLEPPRFFYSRRLQCNRRPRPPAMKPLRFLSENGSLAISCYEKFEEGTNLCKCSMPEWRNDVQDARTPRRTGVRERVVDSSSKSYLKSQDNLGGHQSSAKSRCPGGEIGRRNGLKIRR